ncbi:MAG: hypothetical protein KatS3mg068_2018 [Candidatus Sericytochromatia bacterium]|nr:MAG: hypothetical protein KatS3mg068_2018 [Candidatus Sericytochromatia bacterium]
MKKEKKIPLLLKDMYNFNISIDEIKSIELCNDLPNCDTLENILGTLYVIEGATLGGEIVAKKLENIFKKEIYFFNSYKENIREMWKSFCNVLNDYAKNNIDKEEEIIKSSENTYFKFNEWLKKIPQHGF